LNEIEILLKIIIKEKKLYTGITLKHER